MSDVPLREYLENMFAAQQREIDAKHRSMADALLLAREDVARRLAELNELRHDVVEDRAQFVSKLQFDPMMQERDAWRNSITERLNAINDRITKIETRGNTWTVAIGLFFIVLQIALMFLLHK